MCVSCHLEVPVDDFVGLGGERFAVVRLGEEVDSDAVGHGDVLHHELGAPVPQGDHLDTCAASRREETVNALVLQ